MNAARNLVKKNEMLKIVNTAMKKYNESEEETLNNYLEDLHNNKKINRKQKIIIEDLITNKKGLVI